MKKFLALILALIMTLSLAACGDNATKEDENQTDALKLCMITDTGGLGDNGFNDMAWAGMEMCRDEFGCQIDVIESSEAALYASNVTSACDQGYDVVILVGYLLEDALKEVAPLYPDTSFIIIDGSVDGDNIYSFKYDMQESSFLAGAVAATVLKDCDTFGVVIGMEIPDCIRWGSGWISGIKAINPDATVLTSAVGSFADPDIAKEQAKEMYAKGAKAIMEVSSGGAIGVIEAAAETGNYFVATDKSKDDLAPGSELTAALAGRDMSVYAAVKAIMDGTATPGTKQLKMEDGVYNVPEYTADKYGQDVADMVETLKAMIISGKIVVPTTYEEAQNFQAISLD